MNLSQFIINALAEDVGDGDHTSLSCISITQQGKAHLLVKENGMAAGIELAKQIFEIVDTTVAFHPLKNDGDSMLVGDVLFTVTGNSQSILKAERLVLNCMQRMSGIATTTAKYVKEVEGLTTKILDTRKTTPLCRNIEKWAVKIGGGYNHRFGLFDMIMIKDNHVDYAGGIANAIHHTMAYLKTSGKDLKVEIETRNLKEVNQVLEIGNVDRILLDNMQPELLKEAVQIINNRVETEASGGITLQTIRNYAETGVNFISVGALTHSAKSIDLSLKAF